MADLPVKYQKLAAEYAKLKAQNHVLKKGVVDAQSLSTDLQEEVRKKDQSIRRLNQEIDSSNFRSEQMACRIELLQVELNKNDKNRRPQGQADERVRSSTGVLNEDLRIKIQENEMLHKQMHEADMKKQQLEVALTEQLSVAKQEITTLNDNLSSLKDGHKHVTSKLEQENETLQEKLEEKESELNEVESEMKNHLQSLDEQNHKLNSELKTNMRTIHNTVVFDDCQNDAFVALKVHPFDRRSQTTSEKLTKEAAQFFVDFFTALSNFHNYFMQRCQFYPTDSTLHSLSPPSAKLVEYLGEHSNYIEPLKSCLKDCTSVLLQPLSSQCLSTLRFFCSCFRKYEAYVSKLNPYHLKSLQEECDLSLCAPTLQAKNLEFVHCFQSICPCINKLSVYLNAGISSCAEQKSIEESSEKNLFQKIASTFNELHLLFKDMSKAFNSKIALEYQLPTTTKEPRLRSANEFLLSALLSLASVAAKISGFITENLHLFSMKRVTSQTSAFEVRRQAVTYLDTITVPYPPPSVDYETALHSDVMCSKENRDELIQQLEKKASLLQSLEQEKEHWLLESQLWKMKLEKQQSETSTVQIQSAVTSSRQRTTSASLAPTDTSMLGALTASNAKDTSTCTSTEDLIKQHMTVRITESGVKIQVAEAKSIHFEKECGALHKHLAMMSKKKNSLQQDLDKCNQFVAQLQDELAVTRRSYEEQLSLMSEHLAAMNDKLASQKDQIDSLKVSKGKKLKVPGLL